MGCERDILRLRYDYSVLAAINYAESRGAVVVFAAGNNGKDSHYYPAYYTTSVAVAATTNSNARASFSNYGAWIDISAPGVSVASTVVNGYSYMSGTSMACPHVAGVLALGFSVGPAKTAAEAKACLFDTAASLGQSNLGAGLADAAAMAACMNTDVPSSNPTASRPPSLKPTTPIPTTSLAPSEYASCGECDLRLRLKIKPDRYPGETTWELGMADSNGCGADASGAGGPFDRPNRMRSVWISQQLCRGRTYTFTIKDSRGRGAGNRI